MSEKIKRIIIKVMMFISSYFPLYFMLIILHSDKMLFQSFKQVIFGIVLITCIFISILTVILLKKSKECNEILELNEIERPDDTVISYMMTYIIPIVTMNVLSKEEVIVNIALFMLIGYLYIRLNLLYLNPLWSAFGYFSYRVNSDIVIITNLQYIDLKTIKVNKNKLFGVYIANGIFLAQKVNNK